MLAGSDSVYTVRIKAETNSERTNGGAPSKFNFKGERGLMTGHDDALKRLTENTNRTSADAIINKHVFIYNNLDLIGTVTIKIGTPLKTRCT